MKMVDVHKGSVNSSLVRVAEVFKEAIRVNGPAILVAHNHPSGDPRPSDSDLRATRRLATAAEALDCTLLDHLVFAGEKCTSLRRLGYL
jgi:DNA repair protein RadC